MPTPSGVLTPPRALTDDEISAIESKKLGFFSAVKSSIQQDWVASDALRFIGSSGYEYDPDFQLNDEQAKELVDGLPPEYWDSMAAAGSMEEAREIRAQMLSLYEREQQLAESGWSGTGARILANIVDPVFLAASAISGGLAATTRVTRLGRILQGGLVSAAADVPITAAQVELNPTRDSTDVLWAALGSFGGGALFGAAARARKSIEFDETVEHAIGAASARSLSGDQLKYLRENVLSANGRAYFKSALEEADQARVIDRLIADEGLDRLDPEYAAELRAMPAEDALQRLTPSDMRGIPKKPPSPPDPNAPELPPKQAGDFRADEFTDAPAKYPTWRLDQAVARFSTVPSSTVRRTLAMMLDDRLTKADGTVNRLAASRWIKQRFNGARAANNRVMKEQFAIWAKRNNVRNVRIGEGWRTFNEQVAMQVRSLRDTPITETDQYNPVLVAARNQSRLTSMLGELAKRHGVKGFDRFDIEDGYLTTIWNPARVMEAMRKFGVDKATGRPRIEFLFADAFRRGAGDAAAELTDEQVNKVAKVFVRNVMDLGNRSALERNIAFSGGNRELLEAILRDEIRDIDDNTVDAIVKAITPRDDANVMSRAKRRTPFDLKTRKLLDTEDGALEHIGLEDMLENDASKLFDMYARQILGHSAEAEILREMQAPSWQSLIGRMDEEMIESGMKIDERKAVFDQLDWAHKAILGQRIGSDGKLAALLRRIRGFNHFRDSGSFGIPALLEMHRIVSEGTFREALKVVPEMGRLFRKAADGSLGDEEMEYLELMTGLGADRIANQIVNYGYDEAGTLAEHVAGRVDRALEATTRFASDLSGLAPVTVFARRVAALSVLQKITKVAASGRSFSDTRLKALGITKDDWNKIVQQVQKHKSTETGALGRPMLRANWHKWDDIDASSKLQTALVRFSNRVIQDEDLGDMRKFLSNDWAKLIFQFRRFALTSWTNQTLKARDINDTRAYIGLGLTTLTAAAAYVGRAYAMSIGREDAEEFREEMLSLSKISRAAVGQSSWMSVAPAAIDPVLAMAGFDSPVFGFARYSSGLQSGQTDPFTAFMTQNPTSRGLKDGIRGISGMLQAGMDDEEDFSRQDARALIRAFMPFRNIMGISKILDLSTQQLPED